MKLAIEALAVVLLIVAAFIGAAWTADLAIHRVPRSTPGMVAMQCMSVGATNRCENREVVCYGVGGSGLQCHWKGFLMQATSEDDDDVD